jgi:tryptophan synthase alpha chain
MNLERVALFRSADCRGRGLCLFLNAGDPPFEQLARLAALFDSRGVDCLELGVPFPNAATGGAVFDRSARRALKNGADLSATLAFVASVRPTLHHLKIVLLVDWRHTARELPVRQFLDRVKRARCDGLILHGVPPRLRPEYYRQAAAIGQPIVTSCFVNSAPEVVRAAATEASAFVYLMARYGSGPADLARVGPVIAELRRWTDVQVAVGFGIRTREQIRAVWAAGADAAIVGSACVEEVERANRDDAELEQRLANLLEQVLEPGPALIGAANARARPLPPDRIPRS